MCGINDQYVNTGLDQRHCPFKAAFANAGCRGNTQTTAFILARIRVQFGFFDVLDGNQAGAAIGFVNHQKLFNAMLVQKFFGFFGFDIFRYRNQIFVGHQFGNRLRTVGRKTHISVGQNADQLVAGAFNNRNTGNVVDVHQVQRIGERLIRVNGDRVDDHTGFKFLYAANLFGLLCDIEVLVNDPHTTMLRHNNRHRAFGHCVHCGRQKRNAQVDIFGNAGVGLHLCRQHFAGGGFDQNVIKRQGFCNAGHMGPPR